MLWVQSRLILIVFETRFSLETAGKMYNKLDQRERIITKRKHDSICSKWETALRKSWQLTFFLIPEILSRSLRQSFPSQSVPLELEIGLGAQEHRENQVYDRLPGPRHRKKLSYHLENDRRAVTKTLKLLACLHIASTEWDLNFKWLIEWVATYCRDNLWTQGQRNPLR